MNITNGYPYTNLYGGYRSLNHNGVTGSNKDWMSNGTITTDTTIYLSSTKSTRLTPNVPLVKLISPIVRVPVKSGDSQDPATPTEAYPIVSVKFPNTTFSNDGVAEFYVDCDGTAGWINIDDWNTTTTNDSRGQ